MVLKNVIAFCTRNIFYVGILLLALYTYYLIAFLEKRLWVKWDISKFNLGEKTFTLCENKWAVEENV